MKKTKKQKQKKPKKTEITMNKPVYLELSILELSQILMHGFCYDYIKRKYGKKLKYRQFHCMHNNK